MTRNLFIAASVLAISALILSSCDTPVGQGAAGALTGKIVEENQTARYGPPPPGGYPYGRWAGRPGFYYSPYTGRVYDLRGVPPGGLTRDVDTGRLFRKP
jgi:hypothetical protein